MPLALLGADIELVGGVALGSATVAVPESAADRLPAVLARLGLDARPAALEPAAGSAPRNDAPQLDDLVVTA